MRPLSLNRTTLQYCITQESNVAVLYHSRERRCSTVSLKRATLQYCITQESDVAVLYHSREQRCSTVSLKRATLQYCITQESDVAVSLNRATLQYCITQESDVAVLYHSREQRCSTVSLKRATLQYCITHSTDHEEVAVSLNKATLQCERCLLKWFNRSQGSNCSVIQYLYSLSVYLSCIFSLYSCSTVCRTKRRTLARTQRRFFIISSE